MASGEGSQTSRVQSGDRCKRGAHTKTYTQRASTFTGLKKHTNTWLHSSHLLLSIKCGYARKVKLVFVHVCRCCITRPCRGRGCPRLSILLWNSLDTINTFFFWIDEWMISKKHFCSLNQEEIKRSGSDWHIMSSVQHVDCFYTMKSFEHTCSRQQAETLSPQCFH